jgi:hypothetical protein
MECTWIGIFEVLRVIIILVVGGVIIKIVSDKYNVKCPPPTVEYRFVPRTLREELETPVKVQDIFTDLWDKPSPFVSRTIERSLKNDTINGRFISQSV